MKMLSFDGYEVTDMSEPELAQLAEQMNYEIYLVSCFNKLTVSHREWWFSSESEALRFYEARTKWSIDHLVYRIPEVFYDPC